MDHNNIINIVLDNLKKFFYPEDWIDIDQKFSKTEIFVLLLVHRQGELTMSSIAEGINSPLSTATGIVDRLVKNGFAQRERCDSDRRVVVIRLTNKGKEVVDKIKTLMFQYIEVVNDSLTDEEKRLLIKIFFKIMKVIEEGISEERELVKKKEKEIQKIDIF